MSSFPDLILRCLQLLEQHRCPLCRTTFEASEVRRLHIDGPVRNSSDCSQARSFLGRITKVVREGALASEVRILIQDVRDWLETQPAEEVSLSFAIFLVTLTEAFSTGTYARHTSCCIGIPSFNTFPESRSANCPILNKFARR